MKFLPLVLGALLIVLAAWLWPGGEWRGGILAWVNETILLFLAILLIRYGIRLLRQRKEPRPGSRLRAKLVIALVGMLMVPSLVIQLTASQMVERGMAVWFDVRVDKLLDRALKLAQGFYERIEKDLKRSLRGYIHDPQLAVAARSGAPAGDLIPYLAETMRREGWEKVQLFDINERFLAGVQEGELGAVEAEPLSDTARLSLQLGQPTTEISIKQGRQQALGYAPVMDALGVAGLLRVELELPEGVIQSARSVEKDYQSYLVLERNRQFLQSMFRHAMLLVTLVVVLVAGAVALVFARRLTTPIGELAQALKRVQEGDLGVEIVAHSQDELGSLIDSFNQMTLKLRKNAQAIEQAQHDLTEALASSRQRQYVLESLLASLQTGVLLIDAGGRIRLLNQSFRELLSVPSGWIPGASFIQHCQGFLPELAGFYDELTMQPSGYLQQEFDVERAHRQPMRLLVRGTRLKADDATGFSGYLIVIDDITELTEAQRSKAWSEVARRLAHEIKNPLTPIKLAAERLQRRFRRQVDDPEVFDGCTRTIISQVERLQRLVEDFSTLARLPEPRLQRVSVRHLLEEMAELFHPYKHVSVILPAADLTCQCDPDQVRQVIINLVDNALAAAEDHVQVRLYVQANDGWIEWHVEDDGMGIPADIAAHIFEPYFSTKERGSGLGLAIARRIAQDHGGDLELLSPADPTHFCLRLPGARPSMEES